MKKMVLLVLGTRPEAIKLIPLYKALKLADIPVALCATYQHQHLLSDILELFSVKADYTVSVGRSNQDLNGLLSRVVSTLDELYCQLDPGLVIVQGDTTTAMGTALAAFHRKIPVLHVEAGLRTGVMSSPYPEEMNRVLISKCARYHCAPTQLNAANLLAEGIDRQSVFLTGNTVVDALYWIEQQLLSGKIKVREEFRILLDGYKNSGKKIILLTAHRRESFASGLSIIFKTIKRFASLHDDVVIIYPCHPNPHIQQCIQEELLDQQKNICLLEPLRYDELVYTMMAADWFVSDSGGIQEEAACLGKKVIVLREYTERMEGIWSGLAHLVGASDGDAIMNALEKEYAYGTNRLFKRSTLYGDGTACQKIVTIIDEVVSQQKVAYWDNPRHRICSMLE